MYPPCSLHSRFPPLFSAADFPSLAPFQCARLQSATILPSHHGWLEWWDVLRPLGLGSTSAMLLWDSPLQPRIISQCRKQWDSSFVPRLISVTSCTCVGTTEHLFISSASSILGRVLVEAAQILFMHQSIHFGWRGKVERRKGKKQPSFRIEHFF